MGEPIECIMSVANSTDFLADSLTRIFPGVGVRFVMMCSEGIQVTYIYLDRHFI